jgi:hypothetical protein
MPSAKEAKKMSFGGFFFGEFSFFIIWFRGGYFCIDFIYNILNNKNFVFPESYKKKRNKTKTKWLKSLKDNKM